MTKINIMFFIACFFRSMRSKHQSLSYFFNIIIDIYYRDKMQQTGHVLHSNDKFGFETDFIQQFSATYTQQNKLGHFGSHICII